MKTENFYHCDFLHYSHKKLEKLPGNGGNITEGDAIYLQFKESR